jgi:hypothetical protein
MSPPSVHDSLTPLLHSAYFQRSNAASRNREAIKSQMACDLLRPQFYHNASACQMLVGTRRNSDPESFRGCRAFPDIAPVSPLPQSKIATQKSKIHTPSTPNPQLPNALSNPPWLQTLLPVRKDFVADLAPMSRKSRGAAKDGSPRREPWELRVRLAKPRQGRQNQSL